MLSENTLLMRYHAAQKLPKRYRADRHFRLYGRVAVFLTLSFLTLLFGGVMVRSWSAFYKTQVALDISFDSSLISEKGQCLLAPRIHHALKNRARVTEPEPDLALSLISPGACSVLLQHLRTHPQDQGRRMMLWIPTSDAVDLFFKYRQSHTLTQNKSLLHPEQIKILEDLATKGRVRTVLNSFFFTQGDGRDPEYAGIAHACVGSLYLVLIAFLFAFPVGIATAVYLEELKSKSRLWWFLEVSISNLAAVPSLIFGLLGLAVFLGWFGIPRSSALAGGLTLGLMTLPTIIITSRMALRAIPQSIRYAAQALGASQIQVVFHHVFPLGMPGILTGALLGAARALGETAPLLMIGMMAFVKDMPRSPVDPSPALPIQIFTWARNPEPGFMANAAAGILVLLFFILIMNVIAFVLRRKFEKAL